MARKHHDEDRRRRRVRYDGAFRCGLCLDPFPAPDNDWCPVAEGVVCEDCCRELMMGDERRLAEVSRGRDQVLESDDVIAHCAECERLIRLVSDHILDGELDGVRLPMH